MYKNYTDCIGTQLTLNPTAWNFKANSAYRRILEHVSPREGNQYLTIIRDEFKAFYEVNIEALKEICKTNDRLGKPIKSKFHDFVECSPTNLRYILHSLLIVSYIKRKQLQDIDFVEIGGGYGGLCLFIHKIAPLFGIIINSYTIFDLLHASQLQEKYLDSLNIRNVNYYQLNNFKDINHTSFLISNYAFSEISQELQIEYIDKIINKYTPFGFLTWNFIPVYDFVKNSVIEKEKEYPQTGGSNFYIRFYPET